MRLHERVHEAIENSLQELGYAYSPRLSRAAHAAADAVLAATPRADETGPICALCHQPIVARGDDPATHVGCCIGDLSDCCSAAQDKTGLREVEYLTWDGRRLVVVVSDEDPGDVGEPRSFESEGVSYLTVRAALATPARDAQPAEERPTHEPGCTCLDGRYCAEQAFGPEQPAQPAEERLRAALERGLAHHFEFNHREGMEPEVCARIVAKAVITGLALTTADTGAPE
jgi:hypothetical protein